MDDTKCRITILDRLNDNTDGKKIIDLIDRLVLVDHLAVNAKEMLGTSLDVSLDTGPLHVL